MKQWFRKQGISLRRQSTSHRRSLSADLGGNEALLAMDDHPLHQQNRHRAGTSAGSASSGSRTSNGRPITSPSGHWNMNTNDTPPSPEAAGAAAAPRRQTVSSSLDRPRAVSASSIPGPAVEPVDCSPENTIARLFDAIIHDNVDMLFEVLETGSLDSGETTMNSSGLDVNSTFGKGARPILHVAASLGAHECLCALVRHGADVDKQDGSRITAVHLAARNGHRKCVESLVNNFKADIGITDSEGYTAVHWLANNGRVELLEFLLSLGPSVDFEDHNGLTALHVACHGGHTNCAKYLLQQGADVNKVDHGGRNCLWYACKNGGYDCCELLLRHDAKLVADNENRDPFDMALVSSHSKCAARLAIEFPQLLSRMVNEVTKSTHDLDIVIAPLMIFSRTNATSLRVTIEALSNLTCTFGLQLLCLTTAEDNTAKSFIRLIKVTQQLLRAGGNVTPKVEKYLQMQNVREVTEKALVPVWDALEDWLVLVENELEDMQMRSSCFSPTCNGTMRQVPCYSAACRNSRMDAERRLSNGEYNKEDFKVEPSQVSVASRSASRIVRMIYAYYMIHHNENDTHGVLDHGIHKFFTRHRRVIRWLILRDVSVLFKQLNFILGHSSLMHLIADVIRSQPFEIRRAWFYERLGVATAPAQSGWRIPVLTVPRTNIFENSCSLFPLEIEINRKQNVESQTRHNSHPTVYQHKRPFAIQFEGEPGLGDGVKREWFEILTREILDPNYALFVPSEDMTTYQPNPNSSVNPDHLAYFEFAGRIIGLAIFHRFPLAVHFTRSFYKHMLAKPASYLDAASLDPQYMQSINWILENSITDAGLELSFSTETQNFGRTERIELLPGGANIPVTDDNKQGYVQLLVAQKLSGAIKTQIKSFTEGLWNFVPRSLLSLFDEYELELLISGIPEIDVDDWQQHCRYSGYTPEDPTVEMFWDLLKSFDQRERALVLQFSTGSSRLPLGGFAHLGGDDGSRRFTLSQDENQASRLPTAQTCFNILRLPAYSSPEILREKLMLAIRDASEGFAFS